MKENNDLQEIVNNLIELSKKFQLPKRHPAFFFISEDFSWANNCLEYFKISIFNQEPEMYREEIPALITITSIKNFELFLDNYIPEFMIVDEGVSPSFKSLIVDFMINKYGKREAWHRISFIPTDINLNNTIDTKP